MSERGLLADIIRRHRVLRGLTQEQLAESSQVSVRTLGSIERGSQVNPYIATARRLAEALSLDSYQTAELLAAVAEGSHHTAEASSALDGAAPKPTNFRPRSHLPAPVTPFVGRERDIREVCGLLRDPHIRLVTLTGTGGTGRTRLSIEVARNLRNEFSDGTFFASLASITDAAQVVHSIASVLEIRETDGAHVSELLHSYLRRKRLLLILDNFEHVTEAAGDCAELLRAAPDVKLIVTSRAALRVSGEHRYPVAPLQTPDLNDLSSVERISEYEAVTLFVQRARQVDPGFTLTPDTAPVVAQICDRVDSLPLGIELAAVRVNLLPLAEILSRLSTSRLSVLSSGSRDLPERHQSLRGTIEWSYDLLSDLQQRLFCQLGVFSEGWTIEAAREICKPGVGDDVLEHMDALLEMNLIRSVTAACGRFDMLETIHEYARTITDACDSYAVRARHAAYFLNLAMDSAARLDGPDQLEWLDRLEDDHQNLCRAIEWWLGTSEREAALKFAVALYASLPRQGKAVLAQRYLEAARAMDGNADPRVEAQALVCAGSVSLLLGEDSEAPTELLTQALNISRGIGDQPGMLRALVGLAEGTSAPRGQPDALKELLDQAMEVSRTLNDDSITAIILRHLSDLYVFNGEAVQARELAQESLTLCMQRGNVGAVPWAILRIIQADLELGNIADAAQELGEMLRSSVIAKDGRAAAFARSGLGTVALLKGDLDDAARHMVAALDHAMELGSARDIGWGITRIGWVLAARRRYEPASVLWAAATQLAGLEVTEFARPLVHDLHERCAGDARADLGDTMWERCITQGRGLTSVAAYDFAIASLSAE